MASLHIALEEGFEGDLVVVRVNGRDVYDKQDVKTRLQIGLADSFNTSVERGKAQVEIAVPTRKLTEKLSVDVDDRIFVGASLQGDAIRCRVSKEPFGYV